MVVFPYGEARKFRKGFEKEDGRKFWWDPPTAAGQVPFLPPDFEPRERMLIVEGETDTMAVWQALQGSEFRDKVSVVGLSGTNAWDAAVMGREKGQQVRPSRLDELFGPASRVFVVFDRDDPYENPEAADATEKAWKKIRADMGRKARRVVLPQGVNDLAEFFQLYDWAALQVLLARAAEPKMNYPRLDLSKEPGPVDWLVEGMIAKPDVNVLYGDGGVSKSLWLQALSVAIAEEREEFMGLPLHAAGRVLYVDEENPEDVPPSRLRKLGLTKKGEDNLYYVWYGGVRLDEEPERLLEDIMEWEPVFVALDSFSSLQSAEENDAKEVNAVFNKGLIPITRELKVPVIALHHVTKEGRIRGSTQIRNKADMAIEIVRAKTEKGEVIEDTYTMFPDKPRRGQKFHVKYQVVGYDAKGFPAESLDDEAEIRLERRDLEEEMPF